ncbi:hypothetical protein ACIQUG_08565 [Ensifer sp. NPDC090286]|uniref:hypothetical protein n=1 Tax=Ensifer sp. NPDC090286 TaxID=3363991 RepID=UPI00383B1A49
MVLSLQENIACLTSITTAFDLQQNPALDRIQRKNDRAFHGETLMAMDCVASGTLRDIFCPASSWMLTIPRAADAALLDSCDKHRNEG